MVIWKHVGEEEEKKRLGVHRKCKKQLQVIAEQFLSFMRCAQPHSLTLRGKMLLGCEHDNDSHVIGSDVFSLCFSEFPCCEMMIFVIRNRTSQINFFPTH